MTSDTTNLMPATAKKLAENYTLVEDMVWTGCSCHLFSLQSCLVNPDSGCLDDSKL